MPDSFDNIENIKNLSAKISAIFSQNEMLKGAMDTTHEGIAILNAKGEYVYMNTAHAEMFGYTVDEMIGKTWEILYKSEDILYFRSTVFPKIKIFSSPTSSLISTLAPSRVPTVRAPLRANFIFPVPEASLPAVEICSDKSVAGIIFSAAETP